MPLPDAIQETIAVSNKVLSNKARDCLYEAGVQSVLGPLGKS